MKNIKLLFMLGIVAVIISCNNQSQNTDTELASPVSVENVKLGGIMQFINTTGTANAKSETTLSTEMSGKYRVMTNPQTGRPFKLGDRVKEGQVIVRLEDKEYENSVAIESAKLNLEISEDEYNKQKSLYEKGGVTLYELRNSEVSKTTAQYNYENAQLQLAKMNVVAPFGGVIVDLPYYTAGTLVPSGTEVVSLMSYNKMYLEINLPEKNISDVKIGQEALITNYTLSEDTLIGHISELSPIISTETRTFKGVLEIDNPELKLRPGMFVKADIITAQKDSTIVIPKEIIMTGNRGKYVFVVGRNSTAEDRWLTIGLQNQESVEVLEGLSVNDRLIIDGYETLRDRSKVKVIL
ncbi:efflux RND transporter periplasmic adaptor subunit [Maribellus comscasis]|uniref:Efflux RND transporter periplasmic adaptor subunit n=1 Tax=Maribellus comscasis TaxID=2681766 RepID=A0A6I6JTJ2_9BACT|nr:efflux RND transporter periplasmic adaptor subunit [Maribellus comscasis]QGY44549.1 efflux RND transporter periplasmic adaptor subunit [Maribellus comscasis]